MILELATVRGRVCSRADLAETISTDGESATFRSVDVLVSRLRRKREQDPSRPRILPPCRAWAIA